MSWGGGEEQRGAGGLPFPVRFLNEKVCSERSGADLRTLVGPHWPRGAERGHTVLYSNYSTICAGCRLMLKGVLER